MIALPAAERAALVNLITFPHGGRAAITDEHRAALLTLHKRGLVGLGPTAAPTVAILTAEGLAVAEGIKWHERHGAPTQAPLVPRNAR